MMTMDTFKEALNTLAEANDIDIYVDSKGITYVTFNDFEGFEEDGEEIYRDYVLPNLVEEVEDFIAENGDGDFYTYLAGYQFDYASYDI